MASYDPDTNVKDPEDEGGDSTEDNYDPSHDAVHDGSPYDPTKVHGHAPLTAADIVYSGTPTIAFSAPHLRQWSTQFAGFQTDLEAAGRCLDFIDLPSAIKPGAFTEAYTLQSQMTEAIMAYHANCQTLARLAGQLSQALVMVAADVEDGEKTKIDSNGNFAMMVQRITSLSATI